MARISLGLSGLFFILVAGCGGGSGAGSSGGSSSGAQASAPSVSAIAPSTAIVGNPTTQLVVYGSGFESGAVINWNGSALATIFETSSQLMATIPSNDFAAPGTAKITVTIPNAAGTSTVSSNAESFTIAAAPASTTWVRSVGIAPQSIAWDSVHGLIYASIGATAPQSANSVVALDPVKGTPGTPVPTGNNPNLVSISSDSSYLWVGLDGVGMVQRFQLPSLTPDISFSVPTSYGGYAQQAVSLEAARKSPHTLAIVAGDAGGSPPGNGVFIYDDSTPRPNYIPGYTTTAPPAEVDWVQWGNDDSTLYGTGYYGGYLQPMSVAPSGVTLNGIAEGLGSIYGQYVPQEGLLYSYGGAYDPIKATQSGVFNVFFATESSNAACTADASIARYYCVVSFSVESTDVEDFQLWVYNLNTYALIDVVDFGSSTNSGGTVSGWFEKLVRWGNAGLALATFTDPSGYKGNGGLFLIDGAAVNPNAMPDVSGGTSSTALANMSSLSPESAQVGSGEVSLTVTGQNFTPDSAACWNCNFLQFNFLPTTYIGPTQLKVTIPAQVIATAGTISIGTFEPSVNSFGLTALPFTISGPPVSSSTTVKELNLSGLDMAWDGTHQLLYVATADYDPAYPNSIVAIEPGSEGISKTQFVGSEPAFLDVSADSEYLYIAFDGSTNEARVGLPGLDSPLSWTLANNFPGTAFFPGDLKAAPQSADTTAVTLLDLNLEPTAIGGIAIFDGATRLPNTVPGWTEQGNPGNLYDILAWGNSDAVLASAENDNDGLLPLYTIAVDSSGADFLQAYPNFNEIGAEIHSDFGTGLIYSDDGNVANPVSGASSGSYNASGLVVPDSTLNRTFILGQTTSQANSNDFTIESFDEKAFSSVSSITLSGLYGSPFSMVRWGSSGLAVLTTGGVLYIVQDSTFVSNLPASTAAGMAANENVKMLWKKPSKVEIARALRRRAASQIGKNPFITPGQPSGTDPK